MLMFVCMFVCIIYVVEKIKQKFFEFLRCLLFNYFLFIKIVYLDFIQSYFLTTIKK